MTRAPLETEYATGALSEDLRLQLRSECGAVRVQAWEMRGDLGGYWRVVATRTLRVLTSGSPVQVLRETATDSEREAREIAAKYLVELSSLRVPWIETIDLDGADELARVAETILQALASRAYDRSAWRPGEASEIRRHVGDAMACVRALRTSAVAPANDDGGHS